LVRFPLAAVLLPLLAGRDYISAQLLGGVQSFF
jgi:hypothetical protein